jgi:hypothetical protein
MGQWSAQKTRLLLKRFFYGDSAVKTQCIFRKHFNIAHHGKVPCRNTIHLWVEHFRTSASVLKKKPPGKVRTVRSP